jgi:hypothetical protein
MPSDYGGRGPKAKPSPAMPSPGPPKPKARSRPCGLSLPPIVIRIARKPQHRSPAGLGPRERLRQHHSAPARPPVTPVSGNADPEPGGTKSGKLSPMIRRGFGRDSDRFRKGIGKQKGVSIHHCSRRADEGRLRAVRARNDSGAPPPNNKQTRLGLKARLSAGQQRSPRATPQPASFCSPQTYQCANDR